MEEAGVANPRARSVSHNVIPANRSNELRHLWARQIAQRTLGAVQIIGSAGANTAAELVQSTAILAADQTKVPVRAQIRGAGIRQIVAGIETAIVGNGIDAIVGGVGVDCDVGSRIDGIGGVAAKVGSASIDGRVGQDVPRPERAVAGAGVCLCGGPTRGCDSAKQECDCEGLRE